jgi:hypothetical protein
MLTSRIRVRGAVAATATAVGLALAAPLVPAAGAAPGAGAQPEGVGQVSATSYRNPVSARFADTYADPAVVRG